MTDDPAVPDVSHPPRQQRSRAKLEAVLTATEELLADDLFEALSMAAIAERAGVAVGTIYTRFRNKDELLPALFTRHHAAVAERLKPFFEQLRDEPDLRTRVARTVDFAVDYHREHRGLLRALTMYVRAHPDSIPARTWRERSTQFRVVAELIVGDGTGVVPTDPIATAEFGLGVINSVCREQLLFDDVTPLRGRKPTLTNLKQRLTALLVRDLTSPDGAIT